VTVRRTSADQARIAALPNAKTLPVVTELHNRQVLAAKYLSPVELGNTGGEFGA
jgi:hypothetical protein